MSLVLFTLLLNHTVNTPPAPCPVHWWQHTHMSSEHPPTIETNQPPPMSSTPHPHPSIHTLRIRCTGPISCEGVAIEGVVGADHGAAFHSEHPPMAHLPSALVAAQAHELGTSTNNRDKPAPHTHEQHPHSYIHTLDPLYGPNQLR